jgi:hypothetical protein
MGLKMRPWWWVVAMVAVVGVGIGVWVLWPASPPAPPRARLYSDFSACLLTDERGLAGVQAAPVWAGMQQASSATRAKVSYLAVTGPAAKENVAPFLAGLVQRRCDVIVAVGPAEVSAVTVSAPDFPHVRFVVVGGDAHTGNVTGIAFDTPDDVRAAVRASVTSAARTGRGH